MSRPSTIDDKRVFASVGDTLTSDGAMAIQSVVNRTGISIGSLYNRYGSREGLMARAWLDAVKNFQTRFLAALESDTPDAGLEAALTTPRFCRDERARATILVACRKSEFINAKTPEEFRSTVMTVNTPVDRAIREFADRKDSPLEACRMAMIALPVGAVRYFLPARPVPKSVDDYVGRAYRAVMEEQI